MAYGPDFRLPTGVPGPGDLLKAVSDTLSGAPVSDLLNRAASILSRETVTSGPTSVLAAPSMDGALGGWKLDDRGLDIDRLRRQAHQVIETFLELYSPRAPAASALNHVPVLRAPAPVKAGAEACIAMRIANEELESTQVALYSTNLVSDCGYEIPALRIAFSPRTLLIPPNGEATFEVRVAVPSQAPRGLYSGLVQASGLNGAKTVICVEVQ